MKGLQTLLDYEDNWVTDMGKWFPGERSVVRGKDLHRDLKDLSWTAMLLHAVTGRRFSDAQVRLFEGMCTLTVSYTDPGIWPNGVAALAATARSTGLLGVASAIAVQEAEVFGGTPVLIGIDFLIRTKKRRDEGEALRDLVRAEIARNRVIPDFNRPINGDDERNRPLLALAGELGLADGPHLKLLFEVQEIVRELQGPLAARPSIAAVVGALAADQGLTPRELYAVMAPGFSIGYVACHVDAMSKPEGALFPLRCTRIKYEGPPPRAWDAP